MSVGLEVAKPLRKNVKTGSGNAERTSAVLVVIPYAIDSKDGERGRNRTYNLQIKSYGSRFGCSVTNCSRHNNLMIKRPAWTASKNVEKVGEIEPRLTTKDTKKTQRNLNRQS